MDEAMDALEAWTRATGLPLPRPDGPPSDGTCLLDVLGPYRCVARRPVDMPVLDRTTLGAWLEALGRPVHPAEQRPLLLVTPIPAVPDPERVLLQLLGHPDPGVRAGAVRVLAAGDHPDAPSGLRRAVSGPTVEERVEALHGLGVRGAPDDLPLLLDAEAPVGPRLEALAAFVARHGWSMVTAHAEGAGPVRAWLRAVLGGERGALVRGLQGEDEGVRHGLGALVACRPEVAADLVPAGIDALLARPGVDSQWGLIRALGAGGEEAVEPLGALLAHDGWEVRTAAAMALAEAGPAAGLVDVALRRALGDEDGDVQREAAFARQRAGKDVVAMTDRLARRVVHTHGFLARVRRLGGSLGPFDAVVFGRDPTPALLARLTGVHDVGVMQVAALWLGRRAGTWAAASLDAMAVDRHQRVPIGLRRGAAGGRLAAGGRPTAGGVVHRLLLAHDPQRPGLGLAAGALGAHRGELAALAATDPDAVVRWAAVQGLRIAGVEGFEAVLARVAAVDPSEEVRTEARHSAPVGFRPTAPDARIRDVLHPRADATAAGGPELLALAVDAPDLAYGLAQGLLDHDLRPLAIAAARVIGQVAPPEEAAAWCHAGLRRLADPAWAVREVGAWLLGAMAQAGLPEGLREEALEGLQARATGDPDDDVRTAAAAAVAAWEGR